MMRNWVMFTCILLALALPTQVFCQSIKDRNLENAYIVIVLLESKPGKESELKKALLVVAEKSCLEYRLYQDISNLTKFGLYEKWTSQEQFNKPYIQEFARQADTLLAKPYQGLFGFEIKQSNS